ncbi:MAG TPA: hypothetical protein ENN35_07130 [Deltaproteobacteria bacterium]|nr:hypothetical protein [Deltaproteobacteria bacterium]
MASKSEETRTNQKKYWEGKLAERIAFLTEKGEETPAVNKDTAVKMLKAKIRKGNARLRSIAEMAKKIDEKAARKAEKLAAPKPEKPKKKVAADEAPPEESKRQQKKKQKKEKKEGGEQ